jgi:RecB family endonuclease NucS
MAIARKERLPESAREIVKDPMYLEFLGLERRVVYYEHDMESALITHLQEFLLELGNGYTFVARQKRLLIEDDEFFADLVFYNRLLRCFVVIELKTEKMNHRDLGQLQMYVNYYDRYEKRPDENPTIGILLCPARNKGVVEMTLPKDTAIYASEYKLSLPDKKLLEQKLEEWVHEFDDITDSEGGK